MKKLFYLLLLIPFLSIGQVSTGMEQQFDYGIQNLAPQTILSNPDFIVTSGSDGTYGQIPKDNLLNGRTAQGDTGVIFFAGLSANSATTINIGATTGYVVDNETDPETPVVTKVSYAGASNVTVTTVGSGQSSYVMLAPDGFGGGTISFQNTLPTSAERKTKIWLGKVSHPAGAITLVVNEPDYITSPMSVSRDLFQALGPYINDGVFAYANGANLNINITGGNIHGNGINFANSRTTPNEIAMGPGIVQSFLIRTQTGAGGAATTTITPGFYDVAGTITAIGGSSNQATIQYIWAVPGQGYIVQLGQTVYPNFAAAVAALGRETSFIVYPNLPSNAIPITALVVTKGCSSLADTGVTAQFFRASKIGEFSGSTAGVSTANFQNVYNNSSIPQILTSTALGAVTIKRGSSSDSDNILVGQNGSGSITFAVNGDGEINNNSTLEHEGTTVTRSFSGIASGKVSTLNLENTGETVGGSDYQNEVNLFLKAGTSANHRRYVGFKNYDGFTSWLTGSNAANNWVLYDGTSNVHRYWNDNINSGGHTYINSAGTGRIYLNQMSDGGAGMGTGGVYIGNGGTSPTTQWYVDNAGRMTSPAGVSQNSRFSQTLGGTFTDTGSASQGGLYSNVFSSPISSGIGSIYSAQFRATHNTSFDVSGVVGLLGLSRAESSGVISSMVGGEFLIQNAGTATINNAYGARAGITTGTGNVITNAYGFYVSAPTGSGNMTTYRGLRVLDATGTSFTAGFESNINSGSTKYNIYASGTAKNYFNGSILCGTTTDNAVDRLQINGTASGSPATLSNQFITKAQSDLKADLASPSLTGTPTAPTATAGTNTTQIATTAFVQSAATSGSYTPTLTGVANVTSMTLKNANYTKVGDIVTVSVGFELVPTADNADTVFRVTFPVNRATSVPKNIVSGSSMYYSGSYSTFAIFGQTNDTDRTTAEFRSTIGAGNSHLCHITFQYSTLD